MGFPVIPFTLQFFDDAGEPLAGGFVHTYVQNTTTPKQTWQDADLSILNANPVELDSAGRCEIFVIDGETYKYVLKDSAGTTIRTVDEVKSPAGMTTQVVGAVLWPQTAAELAAGVTPSSYAYPPGDVRRYGAIPGSITDATTAFQAAFDSIPAGGGAVYIEGDYLLSGVVDHPLLGSGLYDQGNTARFTTAIGVLVNGKDNITVYARGGVITWTDASESECGAITFYNCDNVNIYGGTLNGIIGGPALYMAMGACNGFNVYGGVCTNGRAIAAIESDTRQAAATNRPKGVYISGESRDSTYGIFAFAGESITCDIACYNLIRAAWVGSVKNCHFRLMGDTFDGAAFILNSRDGDVAENIVADLNLEDCNQAVRIVQFDNTPATGTTIRNIILRGVVSNRTSDGQPPVQITALLHTGTVVDGVDMSELLVRFVDKSGGASSFPYGVLISPDVACTIRNIKFGDVLCPQAGQDNQGIRVTNIPDATLENFIFSGINVVSEDECIQISGTSADTLTGCTISGGCRLDRNSAGNPVRIAIANGIQVGNTWASQATIDLQNCTNVVDMGGVVIPGVAPYRSGNLGDGTYQPWVRVFEMTSGNATINDITGYVGQTLTLFANGGTQTINHNASKLNLDSDGNFSFTTRDAVTLLSLGDLRWIETGRKS